MAASSPSFIQRLRKAVDIIVGGERMKSAMSAADLIYGQVRVPPVRGTWEFLLAYRSSPLLRMLTQKVAESVAAVEWQVSAVSTKGKGRVFLEDHPLPKLLDYGNELMTGYDLRKLIVAHYKVAGEAHLLKERNALGIVIGLLPMVPTWIVTTPRPGRPWYDVAVTEGGFVGRIAQSEIVTFKDIDLYRPYDRGTGAAMALDNDLGADAEAAKYIAAYLMNNARPDIIITGNTTGGATGLSPDESDDLGKAWLDKFQGPSRAGLPLISSGDLQVHEIGKTQEENQFVELRKFERDLCISLFGVPPEIVGVLQSSNRATVQAAQVTLARQVMLPILTGFRETMRKFLVPEFDARLQLDFENPVPDDQEMLMAALQARPWMARVDEHRVLTGLEPLGDATGDLFPQPITLSFATQLAPESLETPPGEEGQGKWLDGAITRALRQNGYKRSDFPLRRAGVGGMVVGERGPELFLTDQRSLKEIKGTDELDDADLDAIVDAVDPDILVRTTAPVIRELIRQFGEAAAVEVGTGISFDLSDPKVTDFIDEFGADRITGIINETTRNQIRSAISDVWDEGGTQADMVEAIQGVFSEASDARARNIAATETNRAANFATQQGIGQAGAEGKEWLSTRDGKVRNTQEASHVALDGQKVAIDEDFTDPVSGATGPYPGSFASAAETCGCRCGIVPVITMSDNDDEEAGYDTEEMRAKKWQMQDRMKRGFERAMLPRLKSAFSKQQQLVIQEARRRFRA